MISLKQKKILAYSYTKYDALICDGAIRSGKTSIMTLSFVDWAMRCFNNTNFAICGKTVGSAIKNIVVPYLALSYTKKYNCKFTRSDNKLVVSRGSTTNTFYIYGGKDESSYQLIQGITLGGVLLDEVALMTRSFVEQALARCSVAGSKYWFNCNPETPNHWFYTEWIKKAKEKNALHLHFDLRDNPSLSIAIINRYEHMYAGVFYDRYIRGLWVAAEGAIYSYFNQNKQKLLISKKDLPKLKYINIGVDFGGNQSDHAFVATGLDENTVKLYVLKAKSIKAAGMTPQQLYTAFKVFAKQIALDYGFVDNVYCDSAEQTLIAGLRAETDYRIRNSIKNKIIDRIRATTSLMARGNLFIVEDEADHLVKGFENAVYDSKQLDDARLDNGTSNIDILDAFEYSFERYLKRLQRV